MAVSDSRSVSVNASVDQVLAVLRDIDNQKTWFPGNLDSEVLERDANGLPSKARLINDVKVAKDEFVLNYTHNDNGFSWVLAEPTKMQKDQTGSWTVVPDGSGSKATLALEINAGIPLPGFVQKKTLKDTLKGATEALKKKF